MLKKLKRKFVLINMACVSFLLVGVFVSITGMTYRAEREAIYRGLERTSLFILNVSSLPPSADDEGFIDPNFSSETVIVSEDGRILEAYRDTLPSQVSEETAAIVEDILNSEKSFGDLHFEGLIYHKRTVDDVTAITVTGSEALFNRLEITATVSGLVLLCCFILFFVLSYVLSGIAMKPAEKTWSVQKQFVADASHDLKTPLTVILANTEIIKSREDSSVASVTKWLDSTKEESERMRRLVDNMLELAKSDDMSESLTLTDTNISEICEMTVLQMDPIAFEKGVNITSKISPNIILKSDADSFSRIVHILIENAIKYAPQGTDVTVTLKREWRDVKLSVKNSGSYINKEDLPHIFERFYRSDKTRGSIGFGLGLSIAKGLCEKMNAEIKCESKENLGTEFTVDFNVDLSTLIPNLRIKRNDS